MVQGWVVVDMVISLQVSYMIGDFWLAEQLLASQGDFVLWSVLDLIFLFLPMAHQLVMVGDSSSIH
jgi:hypothetical protein